MADNKDIEEELRWFIKNPPSGSMKGLPILRVLVVGMFIIFMLAYSIIYFTGAALSSTNALPGNSVLNTQYSAISLNSTNPQSANTLFLGIKPLSTQLSNLASNFTLAQLPVEIVNTLTTVASFFLTIGNAFGSVIYFATAPFGQFGIPVGYFDAMGTVLVVALLIIAILTIWGVIYS